VPRYAEFIGHEIQKAYLESYSDYGQNLFDRFMWIIADAWIEDQDFKDPIPASCSIGALLNQELTKIEKPAGISPARRISATRSSSSRWRSRAQNSGKNPSWTSYEKIREVIEKRYFRKVEDLLPVISVWLEKGRRSKRSTASLSSAWWGAAIPSVRFAGSSNGTCG